MTSAIALGCLIGMAGLQPLAQPAAAEEPDRPAYLERELFTGEFHSHTSVSDGVHLPPDAFDHVAAETEADFFAVSEHDVMWDIRNGDDFIDDWRDADSEEWRWVHEQAEAYNASQDDLVAVPSIENTWYDGTGHINVFNTDWHATARATQQGNSDGFANSFGTGDLKYDMYTFFARLKLDPDAIAQFNHPRSTGKGNFFDFNGLDPVVDERIELIEVRDEAQFAEFQNALDVGWHLGPVWNGDEHSANWVTSSESITGIWAREHSLDGLYAAMQDRSVYSTQDVNTVLAFGAGDAIMGSVLPAGTTSTTFDVRLTEPDTGEAFTSVQLLTNGGEVAHSFDDVSGNTLELSVDLALADGDFYYVRADQADGDFVVSAPIWVGETTRGANYAPVITIAGDVADHAVYGQEIALPAVTATDDSGETPTVSFEVYDAAGEVPVTDGSFQVRSYDDHFVVVKAEDATGNINAELLRITIDTHVLDPDGVFQYFGSTAAVSDQPGGTGIAVSTDRSIETVYAQVRPAGQDDWSGAEVLTSTNDRPYEVNTIGNEEPVYQHSITGQTLRSHEFGVTGLEHGERYVYRFGVAVDGAAPEASHESAWTEVQGEFVAAGGQNEPVYVVGDLQVNSHDTDELGLLRDVLDRLQTEAPGGGTVLQTGDLVDNGGRGQYWDEVFEHVYDGLDLQVAPVAGNHETYGDLDYNSQTAERTAIFSNMYDLPEGGAIGESNYSFDRGDIHFAVLNSTAGIDAQLAWLTEDIRSSTRDWNVVVGHYSYYGGYHAEDAALAADRPKITAALETLGVDLYIGAHDHVYKRSTIFDDRLAETPEEEALGTTVVTMGSAGPKFRDNVEQWWDDVVFDEDTQMGSVLEVTDEGLQMTAYTLDGRTVDTFTVTKPTDHWQVTSTDIVDRQMEGVGLLSYAGSPDDLTVAAATYDRDQEQMVDLRTVDVALDHRGREQFVTFDSPLPVEPSETVRLFVWDSLASAAPLVPAMTVREGLDGGGTAEDPYLLQSAADLPKIAHDPAGEYLLVTDIDLTDVAMSQLGRLVTFTGVFDGGGHTISGYTAPPGEGVGLFADNHGTIRRLVVHGEVTAEVTNAGLLADVNHGTIEQVRTAGTLTASSRVGGIVGDHHGTLVDSYSTADVRATGLYAGGTVGIARSGSVTANVLATGAVVADTRNAGGVVSYGYEETAVQHVVSLNSLVSAPSYAHAVIGRVGSGHMALLADNHVSAAVPVSGESLSEPPAADNWKGAVVSVPRVRTQAFFEGLGWDFATVWGWSADGQRPILRASPEDVPPVPLPDLPQDADGAYIVDEVADLDQIGPFPEYDYVLAADLDLTGSTPPSAGTAAFTGTFDGAGHTISGLSSSTGGLFGVLAGSVHDLAIVDAAIVSEERMVGIVANESTAESRIERVFTSGSVQGASYVAGMVGSHSGLIADSYSLADVTASGGRYSGGIAAVPRAGSSIERTYAMGAVHTVGDQSAGGITGYSYAGTVVRESFALNTSVSASAYAQRVVARTRSGETPTLVNNYAVETLVPAVQSNPATGPATLNGETRTVEDAQSQATWDDGLGWDFDAVWQWSTVGQRPILRSAVEDVTSDPTEPEGPALEQDSGGFYLLGDAADLEEVADWPTERYRLTADLDVTGIDVPQLGVIAPFTGELDGAGYVLTGFTSDSGGLFRSIGAEGIIHDIGITGTVTSASTDAGILVNVHRGTLERVHTDGSVAGPSRVGGIVGTSFGTIRDSYSTADVTATVTNYAGGIIGVADSPSLTERVLATGAVEAVGTTAGGITGYARDSETVVRSSVALNPTVTAEAYAQRVVARSASGQSATLDGNHAVESLVAATQSNPDEGPTTLNGQTLTAAEVESASTWSTALGWDLETVWAWDESVQRPVLGGAAPETAQVVGVPVDTAPIAGPPVTSARSVGPVVTDRDRPGGPGRYIDHEAVSGQDGVTTVTLHAGADAAGEQVGLFIVASPADARRPSAQDIVFLNEVTADDSGDATVQIALPSPGRGSGFWIVAGTSTGSTPYVARLDAD
ncbi:metallophosphoesterase [Ruania alkalisoli]|uniref:Metallophosphoesterase n=1 Tax=Ruania alkalisoli TaxID=2779775 RepID=A0A7M1SSN6_9MICO|nr:metallophosphoesterase [Ruania alkalisoli]QOR70157.1 metallophosphoesterase [Ruania alkalisoli]